MKQFHVWRLWPLAVVGLMMWVASPAPVFADTGNPDDSGGHGSGLQFLWVAVLLLAAKFASLIERWKQPAVLGELVAGVVLGNLVLVGLDVFEPIKHDGIIAFLAQLGVVILLFQIGLESNLGRLRQVGIRALAVATVGVVVPFALGFFVVPYLLPGLSTNAYLFIGATLTATSVGITARVFRDVGRLQTAEAQIVLGAAVLDDVIGLIILAVVSALVTVGSVSFGSIAFISGKALAFLIGAIVLGRWMAPALGRTFSFIHAGTGMKFTLAVSLGLVMAYFAGLIGLAPIVGAFAAGLVLDPVHFRHFDHPAVITDARQALISAPANIRQRLESVFQHHSNRHIEDLLEPLGHFLVPIFFVLTGMTVDLRTLFDPQILFVALGVTAIAFAGKIISGWAAGRGMNPWLVGWGMVPRGEVGLIFATIGRQLGVVNDQVFSIIVIVVILTTLLTPPVLAWLLRRQGHAGGPSSLPESV